MRLLFQGVRVDRAASSDEGAPRLDIRGLTVAYPGGASGLRPALREVSLELARGELLGLVGPNGSGKTTLIRAVTALVPALAGDVRIAGRNLAGLGQRGLARLVAVVPQTPQLPEAYTVLEAVLMGRTPYLGLLQAEDEADLEVTRRAMLATDSWALANRRVGELSGGERQRVVVARALAQETPILLLDEPTAHLDIGHQSGVLELMRKYCRSEGKAVLAVVHDLTLTAQYCHRLVMLDQGAVVAQGKPEDVLRAETLERVYETRVQVFPHPLTGQPVVAPRPREG